MLKYKITTQPTEPITLEAVKAHLRLTGNDEADHISNLITAAREYAQGVTGKLYGVQTVTAVCDSFPADDIIELPTAPIISLTSLIYKNSALMETNITADVIVDDFATKPTLVLKSTANWPSVGLYQVNPIKIIYKSGAIPSSKIKAAMLLLIAHWFENREEVVTGTQQPYSVPFAAEALLQQERHTTT